MNRRLARSAGAATVAAAALSVLPGFANDYLVGFGFSLLGWVALTESWLIISGLTGYISLGHVVFVGLGAYIAALTWQLLPAWAIMPAAGGAAAALALLIGYPCLRVRGPYFVILTFGISELVKFVVVNIEAAFNNSGRLLFGAPPLDILYYAMLGLAWASLVMAFVVRYSRFGAALRAVRENEEAAETIGIPIALFKLVAFVLSAVVPGAVGALMVFRTAYFEPIEAFSPQTSLLIVTMVVIGGGDRPGGPLLGVVFLVVLQELLWANLPQLYMMVVGLLLIAVVIWMPGGITGWLLRRRMIALR